MNVRRVSVLVVAVLIAISLSSVGALAQYGTGSTCPSCPASAAAPCPPACPSPAASVVCPQPCPTTACPPACPTVTVAQAAPCPPPCPPPAPACPPPPCPAPVATCPIPSACPPVPSTLSACTQGLVAYNRQAEMCVEGSVVTGPGLANPTDIDYQMIIRTSDGQERHIWLAPNSFLCNTAFNPAVGDSIAVTGAATGSGGDIIARQVMWNNRMFAFRNLEGVSMWASRDPDFVSYASTWNGGQIVTFNARIDKIMAFNPGCPELGSGVALRVQVNGQALETVPSWQQDGRPIYATVHLGPTWYTQERIARLRRGQTITVSGSPVTWCGQCVVIATQVQQGSCVVGFRDCSGRPLWAGGWQAWGAGTRYANLYDPSYMKTVCGTVESMSNFSLVDGIRSGTMLTLHTTEGATERIALIPEWSTERTGIELKMGDQVTIAGPVAVLNGQQVIIAGNVQSSGHVFALQDCGSACLWIAALPCPACPPPCPPVVAAPAPIASACPTGACF